MGEKTLDGEDYSTTLFGKTKRNVPHLVAGLCRNTPSYVLLMFAMNVNWDYFGGLTIQGTKLLSITEPGYGVPNTLKTNIRSSNVCSVAN